MSLLTRLIINADDFGLTTGVNRAIAELHQAGVVTSATLMANGQAFEDAVHLAKAQPGLGVGCHVVLTDGTPVSPPSAIPSLLGPDRRRFRTTLSGFAYAALLGSIQEKEIEIEADAQITRLLDYGIRPTHIDTHKHTHIFPRVLRPLLRAAERLGIPAIRNPFESRRSRRLAPGSRLRELQLRALAYFEPGFLAQTARRRTTNGAIGVAATGSLDAAALMRILDGLKPGTWELVCHPGYSDEGLDQVVTRLRKHREVEYEALLSVVPSLRRKRPELQLISFADLSRSHGEP